MICVKSFGTFLLRESAGSGWPNREQEDRTRRGGSAGPFQVVHDPYCNTMIINNCWARVHLRGGSPRSPDREGDHLCKAQSRLAHLCGGIF